MAIRPSSGAGGSGVAGNGTTGVVTVDEINQKTVQKAKTSASLGAELIANVADTDFSSATGNWTGTNWTAGSGVYTHTVGANVATLAGYPAIVGKTYQISMTVVTTAIGTLVISFGGVNATAIGQVLQNLPNYTVVVTATSTAGLSVTPNATWTGTIDLVSIKEVMPNSSTTDYQTPSGVLSVEIRPVSDTSIGAGLNALRNSTGTSLTGFGVNALASNTAGTSHTAVGAQALRYNTTGTSNTAIGTAALQNNTTGGGNVAVGSSSMVSTVTGAGSTAVGNNSLRSNIHGSENVAVGSGAGRYYGSGTSLLTNSNQSVFLGMTARAGADNSTNEIVIGYNAIGNGSNTVTIGNNNVVSTFLKGTVVLPTLQNTANDTAAAAAGVPVGGIYRNGSVLMVRVV